MEAPRITDLESAPKFISKCYRRVTQGMINCPVIILSRQALVEGHPEDSSLNTLFNKFEREAVHYYQSQGNTVVRLEHFASQFVGGNEDIFPEAKVLGGLLRKYFSGSEYDKYTFKNKLVKEAIALNGIDPKDYSISFYPPDFLVVDNSNGKWKFVEVKGPNDKLRFRQANWFVNLIPESWDYEIFASLNRQFEETYICDILGPRYEPKFQEEYSKEMEEARAYNEIFSK